MSEQPHPRRELKLTATQRRVWGVLIEKALTTPGSYPLTINALVTGCNQLTCREPIMQLSEGDVARAIHELEIWAGGSLVRQAEVDRSARASRFEHQAEARFGWDKRQRAIVAELLLRGPQTAGELKTNASRMAPLEDLPLVLNILTELAQHDPPFVVELARQPGRSTVRYDHTLYAEPRVAEDRVAVAATAPPADPPGRVHDDADERLTRLEHEVDKVRQQLADMRALIESLRPH